MVVEVRMGGAERPLKKATDMIRHFAPQTAKLSYLHK